jgi:hypothetical protein
MRTVRDALAKPCCSRDQKQPCPHGEGAGDTRDALTARCETFDGMAAVTTAITRKSMPR